MVAPRRCGPSDRRGSSPTGRGLRSPPWPAQPGRSPPTTGGTHPESPGCGRVRRWSVRPGPSGRKTSINSPLTRSASSTVGVLKKGPSVRFGRRGYIEAGTLGDVLTSCPAPSPHSGPVEDRPHRERAADHAQDAEPVPAHLLHQDQAAPLIVARASAVPAGEGGLVGDLGAAVGDRDTDAGGGQEGDPEGEEPAGATTGAVLDRVGGEFADDQFQGERSCRVKPRHGPDPPSCLGDGER